MNVRTSVGPGRRVIATGLGFAEGPVLSGSGDGYAVDLSRGLLYRVTDAGVTVHADVGGGPNGATEGHDGIVYLAQSGRARAAGMLGPRSPGMTGGVQRVDPDGAVEWVTMDPVAPNDLCFGPDGLLYVTDPTRPMGPVHDARLFRVDVTTGEAEFLVSLDWYANGIAFGVEDDAVYVANSDASQIVRFPIDAGRVGSPEVVVQMRSGHPDGFAFDAEGNLVVPAIYPTGEQPGEIQTWSASGELLDVFGLGAGSFCTNVALGADHRLLVTASDTGELLMFDDWPTAGLALHPFRDSR